MAHLRFTGQGYDATRPGLCQQSKEAITIAPGLSNHPSSNGRLAYFHNEHEHKQDKTGADTCEYCEPHERLVKVGHFSSDR